MKGYLFFNARPQAPLLDEPVRRGRVVEVREHRSVRRPALPHKGDSLGVDVKILQAARLLLVEDYPREVALCVDFAPSEPFDVTPPQPCEATEQERRPHGLRFTVGVGEPLQFFEREVHPRPLAGLEALYALHRVAGDNPVLERLIEAAAQFVEVRHATVTGQIINLAVSVVVFPSLGFRFEEVTEADAPFPVNLLECPLFEVLVIVLEVFQTGTPITPIPAAVFLDAGFAHRHIIPIEICVLLELGLEAELAVTEFNHSLRPYRFGEGERFAVLLLVSLCPLGDEVQVQVFV